MSLRTQWAVIACASALGACGDGEPEPVATTTAPAPTVTATATATPAPTTTATPTATATASATAAPPGDEGGDEAGNRVDLRFDLHAEDVRPRQIELPAFLGLRVRIRNQSGRERIVSIDGKPVLELLPGETQTAEVEGLRPGEHVLEAGESGRATLRAVRPG